ncbi:MAG: hypothetical protein HYY18_00360 [Planctomycetes bacterium]|nr:hypothetical protein [Planctomycetota bacterium]
MIRRQARAKARSTCGSVRDADVIAIDTHDLTVGVWFMEEFHLYYQQFDVSNENDDGIGWNHENGASAPFLIDDDNDEEVFAFVRFRRRSDTCDALEGATIFWTRQFGSGSGGGFSERLQVRVRSGGID